MKNIPEEIADLMEEIMQKFKINLQQRGAIRELHRRIEDELCRIHDTATNSYLTLSFSTLKRLCGKDTHKGEFDTQTCYKIALVAGYKDYADYLEERQKKMEDGLPQMDMSELPEGENITIRPDADHYIVAEHMFDGSFLIVKSKGSLKRAGDYWFPSNLIKRFDPDTNQTFWYLPPQFAKNIFSDNPALIAEELEIDWDE